MNRRDFLKQTTVTAAGLTLSYPMAAHFSTGLQEDAIATQAPLPAHIQAWMDSMFQELKQCTIWSKWKALDNQIHQSRKRVQRIPVSWSVVKSFPYPCDVPDVKEAPLTGYAYSDLNSCLGEVHIDFLWKYHWNRNRVYRDSPLLEALGVMGVIQLNGEVLGISGQLFGGSCSWGAYGLTDGFNAVHFTNTYGPIYEDQETFFEVWESKY